MATQYEIIEHHDSNRARNRLRGDINLQMAYNKGDRSMLHTVQRIRIPGTKPVEIKRAERKARKEAR